MRRRFTSRIGNRLDPYRVTRLPRWVNDWLMEPASLEDVVEASGVEWLMWGLPSSAPIIENPLVAELNPDYESP